MKTINILFGFIISSLSLDDDDQDELTCCSKNPYKAFISMIKIEPVYSILLFFNM